MRKESLQTYLTKLDELNVITLEMYYSANPKSRVKSVEDDFYMILVEAYLLGNDHASEMMESMTVVDADRMEAAIYRKIDGIDFADRAARHVRAGDVTALQELVESEYHRVYSEGVADGVEQFTRETGKTVLKTWRTVGDDRVRDTHDFLEGTTILLNERFETYDGDSALMPGGFANAENNVNCRCWLDYTRVNL